MEKYFDQKKYLLGDSAFSTSSVMVLAFNKGQNANLSEDTKYFNTKMPKIRIKIEHCIGLLKAWFHRLQDYPRLIQKKKDLDTILKPTMCACILHNLLIESPVPPDWFDDNVVELDQEDKLNHPIDHSDADTRHNQVFAYMLEEH